MSKNNDSIKECYSYDKQFWILSMMIWIMNFIITFTKIINKINESTQWADLQKPLIRYDRQLSTEIIMGDNKQIQSPLILKNEE